MYLIFIKLLQLNKILTLTNVGVKICFALSNNRFRSMFKYSKTINKSFSVIITSNKRTIDVCFKSCKTDISRIAVDGIPSVSLRKNNRKNKILNNESIIFEISYGFGQWPSS